MFKVREETKTNDVSDGESYMTCVWRGKRYNIWTVQITIVRGKRLKLKPFSSR